MQESRLFRILYYLINHGQTTGAILAKEFEVSLRTIYRDIDVISSSGIPIYTSIGRNGGIQLSEKFILQKAFFNEAEQQDLLCALQSMESTEGFPKTDVLTKLSALFEKQTEPWMELNFTQWGEYRDKSELFKLLRSAILSRTYLHFEYVNSKNEVKQRKVKPAQLCFKSNAWYLQAQCTKDMIFKMFKLTRIKNVGYGNEHFDSLSIPSVQKQIPQNLVPLELIFTNNVAYRVYDEFDFECIEAQKDGTLFVSVKMPDENWLILYLLSFGASMRILSPARIQKQYNLELRKMQDIQLNS